eukprot:1002099-Amphidinium_carterae.1
MREVQQQSPEEVALGMEFRAEDSGEKTADSFGNNELTPPCANIKCGEYSCPAPLELKLDATCCGYCWAEDHVIAVDRHQVTEYNATGHAIEMCESASAPSTCKAPGPEVRCFKPQCRAGLHVLLLGIGTHPIEPILIWARLELGTPVWRAFCALGGGSISCMCPRKETLQAALQGLAAPCAQAVENIRPAGCEQFVVVLLAESMPGDSQKCVS